MSPISHHLSTVWIRVVGLAFALAWAMLALSFWQLRNEETFLPRWWPLWYALTAVISLVAVSHPSRALAVQVAGAMSIIGAISRVLGVALNYFAGSTVYTSPWRIVAALALYGMLSIGMAGFWLREVAPWAASERRARA